MARPTIGLQFDSFLEWWMEEPRFPESSGLLSTTVTFAGIAIALVTIDSNGPLAELFMVSGLLALGASAHILAEMWQRAGRSRRHLFAINLSLPEAALVYTVWAMVTLGVAYVAQGFSSFVL